MKKTYFNTLIFTVALSFAATAFAQTPDTSEPEIKLPETAAPAVAPTPAAPTAKPIISTMPPVPKPNGEVGTAPAAAPAIDKDLAIKNANGVSVSGRAMPINPTILVNAANGIAPPDAGVAAKAPVAAPGGSPVGGQMMGNPMGRPGEVSPVNPADPTAQVPVVRKPYKIFEGTDATQLNTDIKSVMFDRALLPGFYKRVLKSKLDFGSSKSGNPADGDLVPGANTVPTSITAPVFHLSTVLIPEEVDSKSWSIWVNTKRIRNIDAATEGLNILAVTKTSITAQFQNKDISLMSPNIETNLKKINDPIWDYQSEKGDIKYSVIKGLVEFTVKLNQTFVVNEMRVVEGKAEPTTITLRTAEDNTADQLIDKVKDSVGENLLDNTEQVKPVEVVPNSN